MKKFNEKIEKTDSERYEEKSELIKELTEKLNQELGLIGKDQEVTCTPDLFIVPIVHADKKVIEYNFGCFKTKNKKDLKIPIKVEGNEEKDFEYFPIEDVIHGLIKYGPEFSSDEEHITKKCWEKFENEQ
jgi:hypothetical protein